MEADALIGVAREGLILVCMLVAPPVGAAVVAGLAVSVVQTATQIQEQTVSFAVRFAAVVGALIAAGPWIGAQLMSFASAVMLMLRDTGA